MADYSASRYGEVVGDYDVLYPTDGLATEQAATLLAELAASLPSRSILEFGVGTGRLALELHRHGLRVAGIDASESMIANLLAKPGGDEIHVEMGDYRDTRVAGTFSVVFLAFNGIFDPRGIEAQLDIFRNAAHHLEPGGYFVVESWVMDARQRNGDWSVLPRYVGEQHVELQLARYDIDANTIERTLVHLRPTGPAFVTVSDTYASPGQLDVMAHVTGFERALRYRTWDRSPFTITSTSHVTAYRRSPQR